MSSVQRTESERVSLRFAGEVDRHKAYEWMAHSDVTASMMGQPDYPENPIPTYEQFNQDYDHYYFDDSSPERGRCFIIVAGGEDVGVVTYSEVIPGRKLMELDIWLRSEADCGRGLGPRALEEICDYLRKHLGVVELLMRPSRRNKRAIAAYHKAGFEEISMNLEEQQKRFGPPDYGDAVVMTRVLDE